MTDLGWGFAGASTWARRYLVPAVRATEGARPVAVFSTSSERGAQFAQDCGLERAHASMQALLGDPGVDVVPPDVFLRLQGKQRQLPRMHADDSCYPSGTTLRTSNFADGAIEFPEVHFATTPAHRLQSAQDAGLD